MAWEIGKSCAVVLGSDRWRGNSPSSSYYKYHPELVLRHLILPSGVFRISKRGAKFSLVTSVHTRGANYVFQFFPMVKKILPRGPWPNGPLKYATDSTVSGVQLGGRVGWPHGLSSVHQLILVTSGEYLQTKHLKGKCFRIVWHHIGRQWHVYCSVQ